MPVINGDEFLRRLRATQGEVWIDGERVTDVTSHPANRHGARQQHYERFFFGDPARVAGGLFMAYNKQLYIEYVNEFLEQDNADSARDDGQASGDSRWLTEGALADDMAELGHS